MPLRRPFAPTQIIVRVCANDYFPIRKFNFRIFRGCKQEIIKIKLYLCKLKLQIKNMMNEGL